jgi:hypothetical protein
LLFVKYGSFDHNHLEGEITSYKNAWTTFVIGIYVTMECFGIKSKSKRVLKKVTYTSLQLVDNHRVIDSKFPT